MSVGLILVDIQNDYFPHGKMELEGSEQAGQVAGRLLDFFRARRLPVFHIQHIATHSGATFFLPDTVGADIHQSVRPLGGETIIQKHFPNSFRETGLLQHLQRADVEQVVIAGMQTHMCVDATTRAAADYGYACLIAYDACATRNLQFGDRVVYAADVQTAFLAALNDAYGKVISADKIIAELSECL